MFWGFKFAWGPPYIPLRDPPFWCAWSGPCALPFRRGSENFHLDCLLAAIWPWLEVFLWGPFGRKRGSASQLGFTRPLAGLKAPCNSCLLDVPFLIMIFMIEVWSRLFVCRSENRYKTPNDFRFVLLHIPANMIHPSHPPTSEHIFTGSPSKDSKHTHIYHRTYISISISIHPIRSLTHVFNKLPITIIKPALEY